MVVVLPQPFEPKKTEDLAAFDGEINPVDSGEIAETTGQIVSRDNGRGVENPACRDLEGVVTALLLLRKQCNESLLDRGGARARLEFGRRSGCKHLSGVHGRKPVETLGFLHIGRRHDDAHARPASAYAVNQFPELAAGKRVDAGGGLIQNKQIRIMNQRAAQP